MQVVSVLCVLLYELLVRSYYSYTDSVIEVVDEDNNNLLLMVDVGL